MQNFYLSRCKIERELIKDFYRKHFGTRFDQLKASANADLLNAITSEGELYFKEGNVGGYSSMYCKLAWDENRLKCEADFELFDLLFQIDVENGADRTKILDNLCLNGAFGAVKVNRNS